VIPVLLTSWAKNKNSRILQKSFLILSLQILKSPKNSDIFRNALSDLFIGNIPLNSSPKKPSWQKFSPRLFIPEIPQRSPRRKDSTGIQRNSDSQVSVDSSPNFFLDLPESREKTPHKRKIEEPTKINSGVSRGGNMMSMSEGSGTIKRRDSQEGKEGGGREEEKYKRALTALEKLLAREQRGGGVDDRKEDEEPVDEDKAREAREESEKRRREEEEEKIFKRLAKQLRTSVRRLDKDEQAGSRIKEVGQKDQEGSPTGFKEGGKEGEWAVGGSPEEGEEKGNKMLSPRTRQDLLRRIRTTRTKELKEEMERISFRKPIRNPNPKQIARRKSFTSALPILERLPKQQNLIFASHPAHPSPEAHLISLEEEGGEGGEGPKGGPGGLVGSGGGPRAGGSPSLLRATDQVSHRRSRGSRDKVNKSPEKGGK
jgi:hypothetical protein